jgi:hypothetical protein
VPPRSASDPPPAREKLCSPRLHAQGAPPRLHRRGSRRRGPLPSASVVAGERVRRRFVAPERDRRPSEGREAPPNGREQGKGSRRRRELCPPGAPPPRGGRSGGPLLLCPRRTPHRRRLAPEKDERREGGRGAGATASSVERRIDGATPTEMSRPPLPRGCRAEPSAGAQGCTRLRPEIHVRRELEGGGKQSRGPQSGTPASSAMGGSSSFRAWISELRVGTSSRARVREEGPRRPCSSTTAAGGRHRHAEEPCGQPLRPDLAGGGAPRRAGG